jgi:hypothetical protein
MVSVSWSVDPEGVEPVYGIRRGLPDAGAPLHLLGVVLTDGYSCPQRRWLIDNRMADGPLALVDLTHFLEITKAQSEKLADVCVAWVAPARLTPRREWLAQKLPFRFRRFKKLDKAQRWLQTQAAG